MDQGGCSRCGEKWSVYVQSIGFIDKLDLKSERKSERKVKYSPMVLYQSNWKDIIAITKLRKTVG